MSTARWILFSFLFLIAAALMAVVLTPSLRETLQLRLSQVGREILATGEGDLLGDGQAVQVVKYRNRDGIYVEILRTDSTGNSKTIDRLLLPDKHDGLFNFQGRVTRLAIADIDEDGKLELLVPTFDNQLVPHLNVFRYNPAIGRFEPVQPAAK